MSKKIAIIGIGNTSRKDDGIGVIIVESLLKFHKREDLDYFNFGTASFDLLHHIKDYGKVLLIDAVYANLAAGELKVGKLEDIEYEMDTPVTSTHELNLKTIFEISRKLGIKTSIYVAGIQAEDVSFGEGLSETLKNKKEEIIKKISAFIDKTFLQITGSANISFKDN